MPLAPDAPSWADAPHAGGKARVAAGRSFERRPGARPLFAAAIALI
jgi:hypothetical protein